MTIIKRSTSLDSVESPRGEVGGVEVRRNGGGGGKEGITRVIMENKLIATAGAMS